MPALTLGTSMAIHGSGKLLVQRNIYPWILASLTPIDNNLSPGCEEGLNKMLLCKVNFEEAVQIQKLSKKKKTCGMKTEWLI
ncbi:hypothetical protein BTVI_49908 [Pitangus sulphuratus]|nr:hypothetical protein BTVI_49908 [Pitangus sulphuratus]